MWIQKFFKSLTSASTRRRPTRQPASRLCLEALKDRCLPSFYGPVSYPVDSLPPTPVQDFNGDGRNDAASFSGSWINVVSIDGHTIDSPRPGDWPAGGRGP